MRYMSTRGERNIGISQAILNGIARDGGLFVPESFPEVFSRTEKLNEIKYIDLAMIIMENFIDEFTKEELRECINGAYGSRFSTDEIVPLVEKKGMYFMELFHGETLAFKDVALSILPQFMKKIREKNEIEDRIVILTATSGDTGKAALEGFKNLEGIEVIVFYPESGVSEIQKRQMITQRGENVCVVGLKGNFDHAQKGVKSLMGNEDLKRKMRENRMVFSSANSINIGRLIPQIVYYFKAYLELLRLGDIRKGERINFVVPTGNFGNILAGYYAGRMGLPINRLICASNDNNVLYDFFKDGIYDIRREFKVTSSPSMDILVSSNLERLLFEICSRDHNRVAELMRRLREDGVYKLRYEEFNNLELFYGGYANEVAVEKNINRVFEDEGYLMDTHTAVAYSVYNEYMNNTGDRSKTVILSTASPFKFPKSVARGLKLYEEVDDFELVEKLAEYTGVEIPQGLRELQNQEIRHERSCDKDDIEEELMKILGL